MKSILLLCVVSLMSFVPATVYGLALERPPSPTPTAPAAATTTTSCSATSSRRSALKWAVRRASTMIVASSFLPPPFLASAAEQVDQQPLPESLDVTSFLRTGTVAQPMGVSGQAGKSRPETGVLLREGSEVARNAKTGDVLAEILLETTATSNDGSSKSPYLASFSTPWPLAKGTVFDVECRDGSTGDGAFLAVTSSTGGKSLAELKDSFFVDQLFAPTGRFSFYGPSTDVKVQKSALQQQQTTGNDDASTTRTMDLSFSIVSQATQTEIPRRARVAATIPPGSQQAVMLIASSSAARWKKKQVQDGVDQAMKSFRAVPAPKSSLKARAKEVRRG